MSDARDDYHAISHPGVNITAHAYIKELEEQNKEMLDCLIDIIKAQYNNDGTLATLNGAIANSKHVIEKQTGKKIEEILK